MGTKESDNYHRTKSDRYGKVFDTFSNIIEEIESGKKVTEHGSGDRTVYVMKNTNETYYVGETQDFYHRMEYYKKDAGSEWSKSNGGADEVKHVFLNVPREFEDEVTVACARSYGQESVRGGRWHDPDDRPPYHSL